MTRAGGELRGNSTDRYNRKTWMLRTFGDGAYAKCIHCGDILNRQALEADRIDPNGRYVHSNLQPACRSCNARRGNNVNWVYTPIENDPEDNYWTE
jgi:hypothetical protein